MDKPTVFFSHSSKDKDLLFAIKKYLIEKTGNSIGIFLSSDGQSIPLGRNWVHKIQESLEDARIMFVFISPHSMSSHWLLFEAGYAYSKNIKVIPIGIDGVDLGQLPPPISLLQGFNMTSCEGVNNIVAVINSEFGLLFNEDLSQNQFDTLFKSTITDSTHCNLLSNCIREIKLEIKDEILKDNRDHSVELIELLLKKLHVPFYKGKYSTRAHGWSFRSVIPGGGTPGVEFNFAPELMNVTVPHIDAAISEIISNKQSQIELFIRFHNNVRGEVSVNKISAKLYRDNIEIGSDDEHIYKDMYFSINGGYQNQNMYLWIKKVTNTISSFDIEGLLTMLFDSGVLWRTVDGFDGE